MIKLFHGDAGVSDGLRATPTRRWRHERTACSSLANSDVAPSSFLEIPLPWGRNAGKAASNELGGARIFRAGPEVRNGTVILTMSRRVYRSPRVGRLIFWQDRPGRRIRHALAGIRGTN